MIKFTDPQVQTCYDGHLIEAGDGSADLRQVHALIATYDLFSMLEGSHSARVHETLEHLLSARLRPGLRRWSQRRGAGTDASTVEFRDRLNQLAGERLQVGSEATTPATEKVA